MPHDFCTPGITEGPAAFVVNVAAGGRGIAGTRSVTERKSAAVIKQEWPADSQQTDFQGYFLNSKVILEKQ